jgi:hypothetical protein
MAAKQSHETAIVIILGFVAAVFLGMVTVHGHLSLNADAGSGNTPGDVGKDTSLIPSGQLLPCSTPGEKPLAVRQAANPGEAALRINHSLYRRPSTCGHHRAIVVRDGWDMFANPPSESEWGIS